MTDTVPNGVPAPRPIEAGAVLFLAHAQEQVRGHDGWLIPATGLVLGRELSAGDFQLADPRLSRVHAIVEPIAGGAYQVRDLGSRNGTGVNGSRLEGSHRLAPGDVLRVGDTLAVFASPALPPGAAPTPTALGIVGHSPAIAALRQAVAQAARGRAHVLVTGEQGTGKEVVARALHAQTGRPGPFVEVVCSGSSEALLDDELFDHAHRALAHGGTLFLDGASEMPLPVQRRLAQALAQTAALPGGGGVRVIAATSRDLALELRAGRFSAELYAHLAGCVIAVPPLRERREDIPLLVGDLLARFGSPGRAVEADLCQAMLLSPWPLNVRGLSNVVEAALFAASVGKPLALVAQVAQMFAVGDALTATVTPRPAVDTQSQASRGRTPIADELREALRVSRGNVAEAARQFGCSRQQMYRWMRALGIDPGELRRPSS